MVETAQSVVVTAQRGLSNCAAAQARSLEGTLVVIDLKDRMVISIVFLCYSYIMLHSTLGCPQNNDWDVPKHTV